MTDARVPVLNEAEALARARQAGIPDQLARLQFFRLLLRRPRMAKGFSGLVLSVLAGEALEHRLRELVILRIGWTTGSSYEWTQHWSIAGDLGVSEADRLGVRDWVNYDGFGPTERAVLSATDTCIAGRTLSDSDIEGLEARLGAEAVLELTMAIGIWSMASTVLRNLDVPLEEGVAAWPPDGRAPTSR